MPERKDPLKSKQFANVDPHRMESVGVTSCGNRSGNYVQVDNEVLQTESATEGLEVLDIMTAREKYSWLADYLWTTVSPDKDEFTRYAYQNAQGGYFIRVKAGCKIKQPLQACLYLAQQDLTQCVHNVVFLEKGAEINVITGCTSHSTTSTGMHVGISEMFVGPQAQLNFTMIHNWAKDIEVRPRTGVFVEEEGVYVSNYICINPVRYLQMYPVTYLRGRKAVARFQSILVAPPATKMDVGSKVVLAAPDTKAEVIARSITTGGDVINRGHLVGEVPGVQAHLECHGLVLTERGLMHAIPELEAQTEGVEMSHEAAVGKIAPEEVEYLMARGLLEEEAVSMIVRGFLNVDIPALPPELQAEIDRAVDLSGTAEN